LKRLQRDAILGLMRALRSALVLIVCTNALAANAFVVEGPRRSTGDAVQNLAIAPRWAATEGSLVETGQRGLGGGLEYAVDDSVCDALAFVDGSDCPAIMAAIAEVGQAWADGHPTLRFVDVTGTLAPDFPLAAMGRSGQGAEIDIYASTPTRFPPFQAPYVNGYTIFYAREAGDVPLTNDTAARLDGAIQSADIRINTARCYYLKADAGTADCIHFPSLLMHEYGHALGIAHPEERPLDNLDSDSTPGNEIVINCKNPTEGLVVSEQIDAAAVAIGQDVWGPGRWIRGLTWDDVAARDALYPHCDIERRDRVGRTWGALALSEDGEGLGQARRAETPEVAQEQALADCLLGAQACNVVTTFDTCVALAEAPGGLRGWAAASVSTQARARAVLACQEAGGSISGEQENSEGAACRVSTHFCAYEGAEAP
jgi:hypothetical protein